MARKQTVVANKVNEVQDFVLAQLEDARRRLQKIEKELVSRGRAQQKEIESLIGRVRSGKELRSLEKKANAATTEVKKALDGLQGQVLTALGIASHSEIEDITRELSRLSKKVDQVIKGKLPNAQA